MSSKCLIVSHKYHAGHWSHIAATYSLFTDLGFSSYLNVNKRFSSKKNIDYNFCHHLCFNEIKDYKVVILLFPNIKNIWVLLKFRLFGNAKLIYLFHEPINNYFSFYRSGFSWYQLIKLFIINQLNKFTVIISNTVLLPSKAAFTIYQKFYKYLNSNFYLAPLLFDDEFNSTCLDIPNRKYISYIGTIASDHAFTKFCDFIIHAINNELFQDKVFLIATNSKLDKSTKHKLLDLGNNINLKIVEGNWLSNDDINDFYKTSAVVWNSYDRSTQSGVLAKSFMFGTPLLGNIIIPNEFLVHKLNGLYLKNNSDFNEISNSIKEILNKLNYYSINCRQTFLKNFYYKNLLSLFETILETNNN